MTCAGDAFGFPLCDAARAEAEEPPAAEAWATIAQVDCIECVALLALSMGKPADRCPCCRIAWDLGHEVRCPVMQGRPCASCTVRSFLHALLPLWQDGRLYFWCRRCVEEHPRSGRYSFAASGGDCGTRDRQKAARAGAL